MADKVLLVEDDPLIGEQLCWLLEDAGYQVIGPVTSLPEALSVVEDVRCSAAVLDYMLGHDPVVPLAWKLEEMRVPFVVHTVHSWDKVSRRLPLGFAYVAKPYRPGQLEGAIAEAIRRKAKAPRSPLDRAR